MKFYIILCLFFLFLNNCSLNKDSKYWTEDVEKRRIDQRKLTEIQKKAFDIITMTDKEYEIYIDEHTKKSKYPDINK
tara:strand:+ start:255 stop:485 length:231 start_codon:yes stop_codon:yes gene_type:complete